MGKPKEADKEDDELKKVMRYVKLRHLRDLVSLMLNGKFGNSFSPANFLILVISLGTPFLIEATSFVCVQVVTSQSIGSNFMAKERDEGRAYRCVCGRFPHGHRIPSSHALLRSPLVWYPGFSNQFMSSQTHCMDLAAFNTLIQPT